VLDEIGRGDPGAAAERIDVIRGIALLPTTAGAVSLADFLIARHALPMKARTDALHLCDCRNQRHPIFPDVELQTFGKRHFENDNREDVQGLGL
jgi:hypothetical protein